MPLSIGKAHELISETHKVGGETREWLVSYGHERILGAHGIEAVGWVEAREGYQIARGHPALALLYVCLEGWGEVWVDGGWERCGVGQAYLAPSGVPHAYRTVPGVVWRNCWVLGRDNALVGVSRPAVLSASGLGLHLAIQGLYGEDAGKAEPPLIQRWVEMILQYARRIGHPGEVTAGRLAAVWERVVADLAHPWTMRALAQEAFLSEESVRRLCRQEVGRSPMEHVTYLRMRSAASLLASHPYTLSEVAQRVGYSNPFTFSTAFKRVLGVSPSQHRQEAMKRHTA